MAKKYSFYLKDDNQVLLDEVKEIMRELTGIEKPQQSAIINKAIEEYCKEYIEKNKKSQPCFIICLKARCWVLILSILKKQSKITLLLFFKVMYLLD